MPYEFQKPAKNAAREDMFRAMKAGAVSTSELHQIGQRHGLFVGEVTGMIRSLSLCGDIQRYKFGWWTLPDSFTPETIGEVETIGPKTTRVGDQIVHKGIKYVRETKVKGDTPLGRIRELLKQLDNWENQGHKTAGTDYLRRHFKDVR